MTSGYTHGWGDCRLCFTGADAQPMPENWRLVNNPGYAGSPAPRILILGFSKGATQNETAMQGEYDQVPFAGMRVRLQEVLSTLGLMPADRSIDDLLTAREQEFGTSSLVRCSLCRETKGVWKTSGSLVTDAFSVPGIKNVVQRCAATFLHNPPDSLRRVVLLGTNTLYIQKSMALFKRLYADYQWQSDAAFKAHGALWVYAAHPSRANVSFASWLEANPADPAGQKCLQAIEALRREDPASLDER